MAAQAAKLRCAVCGSTDFTREGADRSLSAILNMIDARAEADTVCRVCGTLSQVRTASLARVPVFRAERCPAVPSAGCPDFHHDLLGGHRGQDRSPIRLRFAVAPRHLRGPPLSEVPPGAVRTKRREKKELRKEEDIGASRRAHARMHAQWGRGARAQPRTSAAKSPWRCSRPLCGCRRGTCRRLAPRHAHAPPPPRLLPSRYNVRRMAVTHRCPRWPGGCFWCDARWLAAPPLARARAGA
jgi:hypothetical protein